MATPCCVSTHLTLFIRKSICTAAISSKKYLSLCASLSNILNQHYQEVYGYPALPFTIRSGNQTHSEASREAQLKTLVKLNAAVQSVVSCIRGIDNQRLQKAQQHLDCPLKPLGSLGQLEEVAAQYVAWREEEVPWIAHKAVYVFAADHGITDDGVSAYPSGSDPADGAQLPAWGAAINALSLTVQSDIVVVDVGVDGDFEGVAGLVHRKCAVEPAISLREAAMSEVELNAALQAATDPAAEASASRAAP